MIGEGYDSVVQAFLFFLSFFFFLSSFLLFLFLLLGYILSEGRTDGRGVGTYQCGKAGGDRRRLAAMCLLVGSRTRIPACIRRVGWGPL